MKNPLMKRLPRELWQDKGKYIALFLFLVVTIGFISGFLVAGGSMKTAYDNSFEKYNIEDGHFTLAAKADNTLIEQLEQESINVYPLFFKDITLDNDNVFRVYQNRTEVNLPCLMKGEMPKNDNEIAIDRLYASNNDIAVGDIVLMDKKEFTVTGFVALSDYSALFKNNTDMMFDATHFSIAIVSDSAFETLSDSGLTFCYALKNNDASLTQKQAADKADDIKDILVQNGTLTGLVKQADNQAITFTGDDMGSDKAMMTVLLYVLMAVLAFVFAITTKSTIEQESATIGTLRASGYTKGELLRHYIMLPILVTLTAAVIGNILGYTVMKNVSASLYYGSYSLPTYETIWNTEAFWKTTAVPCIIIALVNVLVLARTLSLSPLAFLRRDLQHKKKKRVVNLPNWKFKTRFRMRIILQNRAAYLALFVGIFLASLILMFGLAMNPLLSNFKTEVIASQISNYQYILKAQVPTSISSAEKYCAASLNLPNGGEEISLFGIAENSDYVKLPESKNGVYLSSGYIEKYHIKSGDIITLCDENNEKQYSFSVAGSYDYAATLAIFMPQSTFNETFGYEQDYYNGYFSNEKLTDVDDNYIATTITQTDLVAIANQLDDSLGSMFSMVCGFAAIVYALLMYLLSKLVVEKNAQHISMIKILGYTDREANSLYNISTAIAVFASLLLTLPIDLLAMRGLFEVFMRELNGWMSFWIAPWIYPAMIGIGILCYLVVHLILSRKVSKIPMSQALKNME